MIENLINNDRNIQVVLSGNDLKELAVLLAEEIRKKEGDKEEDVLITRKAAAEMLNRKQETLWRWAKEGYLVPIKQGGKLAYRKSDVIKILKGERI